MITNKTSWSLGSTPNKSPDTFGPSIPARLPSDPSERGRLGRSNPLSTHRPPSVHGPSPHRASVLDCCIPLQLFPRPFPSPPGPLFFVPSCLCVRNSLPAGIPWHLAFGHLVFPISSVLSVFRSLCPLCNFFPSQYKKNRRLSRERVA